MKKLLLVAALLVASVGARAAVFTDQTDTSTVPGVVIECQTSGHSAVPCYMSGISAVSSVTQATCSTTSSAIYTANSATHGFVRFKVQEGSSVSVYFNWAGATATTSNSELLGPGESIVFGPLTNNVTCITSSGTATVVVTQ